MTFNFRLDAVLRYRENVEQTEEAALYRIVRDVAEAELELEKIEQQQTSQREKREQDLTRMLPAVHLAEIAQREMALQIAADEVRARLRLLETQRVKQLAIYRTAHQERGILSELRDQQRNSYQSEQRRQEQKMLDDLFLARGKPGN
jgi:flagellar export protein FliJ